ncbi:pali-domain-containing protein, partial [Teratosphaeria nubilosa]
IGLLLLFTACILLLITTLSAPIINHVGLLRVTLRNGTTTRHSSVSFGTFGYCILDVPPSRSHHDYCTHRHIGYDPSDIMAHIDSALSPTSKPPSEIGAGTSGALTRVMVLHPIICGILFIAFLVSLGAGVVGSLLGALVAFLAWVLTVVVLATDLSLFGIVKHHVNRDGSGSRAYFGAGMWLLVAGFVLEFFGMVIVLFSCWGARREKRRDGG